MSDLIPIAATFDDDRPVFTRHYAELLPEFMAVAADDIQAVNLDITAIVATMLGAHSSLAPRLGDLERASPLIDITRIRRLDAYAMALRHSHTLYLLATEPPTGLRPLIATGTELRGLMLRDATQLVRLGRIRTARLDELLGPVGYKNLASDLLVLAALFHEHFPRIEGHCYTTRSDIDTADALAAEILRAVGRKERRSVHIAETADIRSRAFTVVTALYDQVRRAIVFLRWNEGDAANIAPSLFIRRHQRKRGARGKAKPAEQPLETQFADPVPPAAATPTVVTDDPFLS